jgi:GT2 family glycosyltransferase
VSPAPHVAVIVLSWNGREDTLGCLGSLQHATYPELSVVCVDNGSTDGSADAVAAAFPEVTLVRLPQNLGFAGGMNAGLRVALESGADAALTLNNDMVVQPGFVEPLADALAEDPVAAAACAQVLFADPPDRVWYAGAEWRPRRGHHGRHLGHGGPPLDAALPPFVTERACAGAMLAPRSALERVGLFDESLFAYAEDVDWSLRAWTAGLHVLVVPASVVRHRVSAASGGASAPTTIYYGLRNGIVVAERHVPLSGPHAALRRGEAVAAHAAQALLAGRRREGLRAVLQGWRDARRGRLGPRGGTA